MSEYVIVDTESGSAPYDYLSASKSLLARLIRTLAERGTVPLLVSAREFYDDVGDEEIQVFDGVVDWLIAEGIARETEAALGDDEDDRILWRSLVLTSLGFRALDRKLETGLTLSETIKGETKSFSGVGDLIGGVLGGFAKSMSSG